MQSSMVPDRVKVWEGWGDLYSSVSVIRMPCDIRLNDAWTVTILHQSIQNEENWSLDRALGDPIIMSKVKERTSFHARLLLASYLAGEHMNLFERASCLRRGADGDRDPRRWRRLYLTLRCPITRMISALSWAKVFKPFQCLMNGARVTVTRQCACTTTLDNKENKVNIIIVIGDETAGGVSEWLRHWKQEWDVGVSTSASGGKPPSRSSESFKVCCFHVVFVWVSSKLMAESGVVHGLPSVHCFRNSVA